MLPMIQGLGVSQQALFVVCRTNRACSLIDATIETIAADYVKHYHAAA